MSRRLEPARRFDPLGAFLRSCITARAKARGSLNCSWLLSSMLHKPPILDTVDYLLMAAGAVVLIAAAWRWRRGGGRDPLRGSPIRANRLTPILLWCSLVAYVAGSGGGLWLGEWLAPAGMTGKALEAWQGVVAASVT